MMRVLRTVLPKGRLGRAVTVSVSGTALAQLIVLVASPLLTRLYSPNDFGILGVFSALLGILGTAVCLRYELAIPLARDDASMVNLLALSLVATLVVSLLTGGALWLWAEAISGWFKSDGLRPLLWLLPVGLLAVGCSRALTHWAIRCQAFGPIARTRVARSVGQVASQIGLAYIVPGPFGLVVGQVIGQSAGVTTLARAFHRKKGQVWHFIRLRGMAQAAARFGNLPTLGGPAALLNSGGELAPALLVAALHGAEVAGWFALAQRVLAVPVFFSVAVAQVYLSEAPRLAHAGGGGLYVLFRATTWRLLGFGLISLGAVVVAGPQLSALVFGPDWTEAGRYAQFLTVVYLGQLVIKPIAQTLTVLERQDIHLLWDALRFGVLLLVFFAAHALTWSPLLTIAVLSAGMSSCYVLLFVVTRLVLLTHLRTNA